MSRCSKTHLISILEYIEESYTLEHLFSLTGVVKSYTLPVREMGRGILQVNQDHGHIRQQIGKKPYFCDICKESIEIGDSYISAAASKIVRDKNKKYHVVWLNGSRYHDMCYVAQIYETRLRLTNRHAEILKPGGKSTRLKTLTPETKKRRNVLQMYYSARDIPALIKAYEQHSTNRVYTVLNTIATRWVELHKMGVEFRADFHTLRNKDQARKLDRLLMTYDADWYEKVFDADDKVETKIAALVRTLDTDLYPPKWPETVTATPIDPREMTMVYNSEGIEEAHYGDEDWYED